MKFDETILYNIKTSFSGTRYTLFDLATWKNGLAFKKIDFSDSGVPVIKISELNNGIGANTSYTQGTYGQDVYLQQGDLLFSWSGNPKTSIDVYKFQLSEGWLNQHIFKVIADEHKVTKDFLYYLLKYLKPHFTQIATNKQTTGLGHVTIADLKRMSVVIPDIEIQRKIVSVIKAIDDKIELSNRINNNLLKQALTFFEENFIIQNNGSAEHPLYDFAEYINGAAFKPDELGDIGLPVIKIAELKAGITDSTRFFSGNKGYKYLVHNKDILFSWSGNPETSIDLFVWSGGDGILNQHIFNVKSRYDCPWFTFLLLKYHKPMFTQIASNKQTTGLGHVTAADLKRITFPLDFKKIQSFEGKVSSFMDL
ncbi:MAG: hypothetical protein HFH41_14020, partial [Lachnospiraceae bacterium]|nr:hypothetical protein [Lachnospiraceae bacterium]